MFRCNGQTYFTSTCKLKLHHANQNLSCRSSSIIQSYYYPFLKKKDNNTEFRYVISMDTIPFFALRTGTPVYLFPPTPQHTLSVAIISRCSAN